ncbi:hypothetical protein I4F81_011111 [Pyropia yezoensis]|uniref:Uncharacterized protein n=1 Tax=Pyropia yezoensis TaxID=2788 RepID=A0ACC3CFS9_PYRYE|nr:hypothetical protein I4F81_011111 [Neopyropia yezoensis]
MPCEGLNCCGGAFADRAQPKEGALAYHPPCPPSVLSFLTHAAHSPHANSRPLRPLLGFLLPPLSPLGCSLSRLFLLLEPVGRALLVLLEEGGWGVYNTPLYGGMATPFCPSGRSDPLARRLDDLRCRCSHLVHGCPPCSCQPEVVPCSRHNFVLVNRVQAHGRKRLALHVGGECLPLDSNGRGQQGIKSVNIDEHPVHHQLLVGPPHYVVKRGEGRCVEGLQEVRSAGR